MNDDGIDTSSDEYRHACEVRWVAALPSKERRLRYLAGVREKRGEQAYRRIVDDLWKLAETRGEPL